MTQNKKLQEWIDEMAKLCNRIKSTGAMVLKKKTKISSSRWLLPVQPHH